MGNTSDKDVEAEGGEDGDDFSFCEETGEIEGTAQAVLVELVFGKDKNESLEENVGTASKKRKERSKLDAVLSTIMKLQRDVDPIKKKQRRLKKRLERMVKEKKE